jgi:hypothetical protein
MADPNELAILQNLQTTFASISTSGGYKSDVDAAELFYRAIGYDAEKAGEVVVGIVPTQTTVEPYAFEIYRCTLTVEVACHVQASGASARYQAISNIVDDIIAAVNSDVTRGGNAIDSKVTLWRSDMGDPDTYDHRGGSGLAVVTVTIIYDREVTSS